MKATFCPCEPDVLDAVVAGAWPEACASALRTHVASCGTCGEVVDLALALRDDSHALARRAPVPPVGAMWWKIASRRRRDATSVAERPIAVTHWLAAASAGGAAAAVVALLTLRADGALGGLAARHLDVLERSALAVQGSVPLLALFLSLVLAPLVIYLVVFGD
jgi:hypothetical protein